jgi:hypothetical protein
MATEPPVPEAPKIETTEVVAGATLTLQSTIVATSTGKRQAFRDIRRQLQDADLSSPGVQKLLLDELDQSESECELLQAYVERFHEADKRAAVLEEKLKASTAFDILFSVGIGLGCAIMGLSPLFWSDGARGPMALVVGFLLVSGATAARVYKK